jgi:hypothetical protein
MRYLGDDAADFAAFAAQMNAPADPTQEFVSVPGNVLQVPTAQGTISYTIPDTSGSQATGGNWFTQPVALGWPSGGGIALGIGLGLVLAALGGKKKGRR